MWWYCWSFEVILSALWCCKNQSITALKGEEPLKIQGVRSWLIFDVFFDLWAELRAESGRTKIQRQYINLWQKWAEQNSKLLHKCGRSLCGYIMYKKKMVPEGHPRTFSNLIISTFSPTYNLLALLDFINSSKVSSGLIAPVSFKIFSKSLPACRFSSSVISK